MENSSAAAPASWQEILEPGEVVLWAERPDPWHYTRPTFILYIAAVPWTSFTYFWLKTVTGDFHWPGKTAPPIPWWMPWIAIWVGLLLLLAGIWMLSAPFWIWRRGQRTLHVLTDRRALVLDARYPRKSRTQILRGKIEFRLADPDQKISDLEIIDATGTGLLFRAVREPARLIEKLRPQPL